MTYNVLGGTLNPTLLLVCYVGGCVPVKAGIQQLLVRRSLTVVRGRSFMAAASLPGAQTHDGFACESSTRYQYII